MQTFYSKGASGQSSIVNDQGTLTLTTTVATSLNGSPIATDASVATAIASKADLVGGVVPSSQIPDIAITQFLGTVANQAAMLALVGDRGDWCIRSDVSKVAVLNADDSSLLASWTFLEYPTGGVTSVNGFTGTVVLAKGDIGLGNVDNTSDVNKPVSTDQQTALNAKANSLGGDDNYVTDAEKVKLTNLSGVNTGDQDVTALDEPSHTNVANWHLLRTPLNPSRWQEFAWLPQVSTTINYWGGANNPIVTGTLTHAALAITNYRTSRNRAVVTGSGIAANFAQIIENNNICYLGNASGRGGFFVCQTFAIETPVALSIGMWGIAAAAPALPATDLLANTNFIALGYASTDGNLQMAHNDATGTATSIDLGASFPARTADTVFRVWLFCENDASSLVSYRVDRLDSPATVNGQINSNLPSTTTLLKRILRESNNITGTACVLNMFSSRLWVKY